MNFSPPSLIPRFTGWPPLSLSLSIPLFFHSFSLSLADSSQVEALRGRVESPYPRTTSAVFHSPQPPTPRGEAAHPPLCVSERTPVRSGTLFCNIVLLEPRNAASRVCGKYWRASNIKKYTTLAPLLWSKRSLLLLPPAVYLIPSLFPFYNTRLSFSLSLSPSSRVSSSSVVAMIFITIYCPTRSGKVNVKRLPLGEFRGTCFSFFSFFFLYRYSLEAVVSFDWRFVCAIDSKIDIDIAKRNVGEKLLAPPRFFPSLSLSLSLVGELSATYRCAIRIWNFDLKLIALG